MYDDTIQENYIAVEGKCGICGQSTLVKFVTDEKSFINGELKFKKGEIACLICDLIIF